MYVSPKSPRRSFDLAAVGIAAFCLLLLRGTASCEAGTTAGTVTEASDIVAKVDGQAIPYQELAAAMAAQLQQLDLQRQELLLQGLDQIVERKLLENEARRRQITVEALLEAEVENKIQPVSQEEVEAWYRDNQARIGRP
ncbi:MAG: SurA N-terminal domain-containing protein, partial [Acidobacteria bacterium]|nr:SurA N-terminal domain-containing protein [Acidobacteriota bacterium]